MARHSSRLGEWIDVVATPSPLLAEVVSMVFYGEGRLAYRQDRILPRGCAHLLINLGPPQFLIDGATGARREFRDLWFSGQHESFIDTAAPGGVALLGVAFRPYGAWIALGHPQQELAESVVPLAALLGDAVGDLRERLLDEPTPLGRVAIAEHWLCQRAERGRGAHPLTRWAAQRIAASRGRVRVEDLARESGFSRKHLSSLFRREIGLTPKALARVHRFHAAIGMLRRSRAVPWSELALECGYYDQSHLIRDFRLFAGCTPEELLRSPAPDELTLAFE